MRMTRRDRCRGSNILEFTLVGIPLVFILISTFEMARGMWNYHVMAYAVKEGTRYASVHGNNCTDHATNSRFRCRALLRSAHSDLHINRWVDNLPRHGLPDE